MIMPTMRSTTSLSMKSISPPTSLEISQILRRSTQPYFLQQCRRNTTASSSPSPTASQVIRPLVPPPDARTGPLLSRRSDRALPNIENSSRTWLKTIPIFIALITVSSLAIFNYQKSSSSTVNSILYALRTNPQVRELLGDEIYFASKIPWISGELNQLHGNINISFWVRGTKGIAQTKFVSVRRRRDSFFETLEWSLKTQDGRVLHLLEMEGTRDPMEHVVKE